MADIVLGAKQLKNPHGYKPRLDTDRLPHKEPSEGYVDMSTKNYHTGDSQMTARPAKESEIAEPEPKKHPLEDFFGKGIKRSNGPNVPRADIQISEN